MKNTRLYAALALLTLSGGAVSQEAGSNPEAAAPDSVITAAAVVAQEPEDKPVAAACVVGDVPDYMKKFFGAYLLSALVNAGAQVSGDSSAAFLAAVDEERSKRGGALDDSLICEIGRKYGVAYICAASITPVPGAFTLSARVMSAETGKTGFSGETSGPLNVMEDLERATVALAESMFGGRRVFGVETAPEAETAAQEPDIAADVINDGADDEKAALEQAVQQTKLTKQPKRKSFWIALSADAAGAGIFGVGIYEEIKVRSLIDKGKFSKSAKAETVRNVCYVIGTVVLASGISIHIFF